MRLLKPISLLQDVWLWAEFFGVRISSSGSLFSIWQLNFGTQKGRENLTACAVTALRTLVSGLCRLYIYYHG